MNPMIASGKQYPYETVADDVLRRIRAGEWAVGERMPTVADLAGEYPHSRATVNRALQTLAEQGYLSLDRGRGIHVRQNRRVIRIGLLVGPSLLEQPTHPFAALLARAARDHFDTEGVDHRLYIERPELLKEGIPCRNLRQDVEAGWLDALITAQCNAPGSLHYAPLWRRKAVPLVDLGAHHGIPHCVCGGGDTALHLALELIRERGAREVAFLSYTGADETKRERLLDRHGLRTRPEWFRRSQGGLAAEGRGYMDTKLLWQNDAKPDALLVLDDVVAKGAMVALLEAGVHPPRDLCLVHHANRGSGIFYPIDAPRVEYDPADYVAKAADLALALVRDPQLPPRTERVEPRLRLEDGTIRE